MTDFIFTTLVILASCNAVKSNVSPSRYLSDLEPSSILEHIQSGYNINTHNHRDISKDNVDNFGNILKPIRKADDEQNMELRDGLHKTIRNLASENLQINAMSGLPLPVLFRVLDKYIFDDNETDMFIGNQNITGMEAFILEAIPVVRKVIQLLKPASLTSTDHCSADMAAYVQGLSSNEIWALKMLDASGKPSTSILKGNLRFMGNYEECKQIQRTSSDDQMRTMKGQYWSLSFTLQSNLTHSIFPSGQLWPTGKLVLKWDVCLPNSCDKETIMDTVAELPFSQFGIELSAGVAISGKDWRTDGSAVAAVVLIMILVSLTLVGTLYDVISGMSKFGESKSSGNVNSAFVSDDGKNIRHVDMAISMIAMTDISSRIYPPDELDSDDDAVLDNDNDDERPTKFSVVKRKKSSTLSDEGFGPQLLLSFSLSRNTEKILNSKTGDSNLGCIHGIRVLSIAWVILGHCNSKVVLATYENPLDLIEMVKTFATQSIFAATLAVDTFFVLSGCLVCYLFLRDTQKTAKGKPTWHQMILYYVHRFWRLTPVYMTVVMFYACLLPYMVEGPRFADNKLVESYHICRRNWWINILYINNIYKQDEMCIPHSWFLANDMQFYSVAPMVLVPLAFGFQVIGIMISLAMVVLHITSTAIIDYQLGGATTLINRNPNYTWRVYFEPWCRVAPFALGLILGYILFRTKCKAQLPKYVQVIGWQLGLAVCLLCTYSTYDAMKDGIPSWPAITSLTYETLSRPGWSLFVCWLIFVCVTGNGGLVNAILSWSAWIPLGRLTYGVYLIHPLLLYYTEFSLKSVVYFNIVNFSYHFIGTVVVSYALSFLTCVLVEAPCMGLEKAVLKKLGVKK